MKKIYILLVSLSLISFNNFAQQSMQASIGPGPAVVGGAGVKAEIYLKAIGTPTGDISENISTLEFNVGFPATDFTVAPTLTIESNVFNIAWAVEDPIKEAGYWNYHIYKLAEIATGFPFTIGTEKKVMEIQLTGGTPAIKKLDNVSLVSLGDAGSTGTAAFIYTGNISALGGNLYYSRTADMGYITTATNGDTYRPTSINSTTGTFTSTATLLPSTVVPVKFLGFNAIKKDNNALLTWQIENESSLTARYEIERSLNGSVFTKVYTVLPKNNGSSSNSYELTDLNLSAIRSAGVLYYRIKQFDKDGRYVSTDIKSLRLTRNSIVIGVYPNPIKNFANITIDLDQDAEVAVTLHDAAGKILQNVQMQLFKGLNLKKIDMESLPSGTYLLKVQTPNEVKTIPLIKAH